MEKIQEIEMQRNRYRSTCKFALFMGSIAWIYGSLAGNLPIHMVGDILLVVSLGGLFMVEKYDKLYKYIKILK